MSKESDNRETVIKWLNNELSPDELYEFQNSSKHEVYMRIFDEVELWTPPDLNVDEDFPELLKKRDRVKVIQWHQTNLFKIAAVVLLILSAAIYLANYKSAVVIETGLAESKEVTLPDSSIVYLAAASRLSYDVENWDVERKLYLEGTAFFQVKKGVPFQVGFPLGTVQVLGTSFEIKGSTDFGSVSCYEGEVSVESEGSKKRLRKGMGIRVTRNRELESFQFENHTWQKDVSRFQSTPLSFVFMTLEKEFNISVESGSIDLSRNFTGAFSTKDLDAALDIVSTSMQLTYERSNGAIIFAAR